MNYEEFYENEQVLEKGLKDKLLNTQKNVKNIIKSSAAGDLKGLRKEIQQMKGILSEFEALTDQLQTLAEGFDATAYMEEGDFARQMIDYCEQYAVDVKGDFPTYEIFPYKVSINAANQEININRKRVHCVRPLTFVKDLRQSREKYIKAPFNVNVFLNELAGAYKVAIAVKGDKSSHKRAEYDLLLKDLYEYIAPTQRARREYDLHNYAFDLARLYTSEVEYTKDGLRFEFGSSKVASKLIRILDQSGKEQFLGTIRFYSESH